MPKFNDQEKESIKKTLLIEGEKLFIAHGLKKVTVNDLVKSAGISHGAFYSFYKSKEHLFMEININHQTKLFQYIDKLLQDNSLINPRERAGLVLKKMLDYFLENPIISQVNLETWKCLERKMPDKLVEQNNLQDTLAVERLVAYGIKLNCPLSIAVKTLQAIFLSASHLTDDEDREEITNIIIDSIVNKIIEE